MHISFDFSVLNPLPCAQKVDLAYLLKHPLPRHLKVPVFCVHDSEISMVQYQTQIVVITNFNAVTHLAIITYILIVLGKILRLVYLYQDSTSS